MAANAAVTAPAELEPVVVPASWAPGQLEGKIDQTGMAAMQLRAITLEGL